MSLEIDALFGSSLLTASMMSSLDINLTESLF